MKGGFNSSFVEVRTFEGPKFIKDLKIGELILKYNRNISELNRSRI